MKRFPATEHVYSRHCKTSERASLHLFLAQSAKKQFVLKHIFCRDTHTHFWTGFPVNHTVGRRVVPRLRGRNNLGLIFVIAHTFGAGGADAEPQRLDEAGPAGCNYVSTSSDYVLSEARQPATEENRERKSKGRHSSIFPSSRLTNHATAGQLLQGVETDPKRV